MLSHHPNRFSNRYSAVLLFNDRPARSCYRGRQYIFHPPRTGHFVPRCHWCVRRSGHAVCLPCPHAYAWSFASGPTGGSPSSLTLPSNLCALVKDIHAKWPIHRPRLPLTQKRLLSLVDVFRQLAANPSGGAGSGISTLTPAVTCMVRRQLMSSFFIVFAHTQLGIAVRRPPTARSCTCCLARVAVS